MKNGNFSVPDISFRIWNHWFWATHWLKLMVKYSLEKSLPLKIFKEHHINNKIYFVAKWYFSIYLNKMCIHILKANGFPFSYIKLNFEAVCSAVQLDGVFHLSKQKSECDNIPKWVSWQTLFNLVEENFGHTKSSEEFLFFFSFELWKKNTVLQ